jgi:tRNA(Arg) A34 adenosine deaminase TadA
MQIEEEAMDDILMKEACGLAKISITLGGGPFGCVITDAESNVIGRGHNRVAIENDPTLHAEMVAIKNACKKMETFNLKGCKLYTSCEPCPMCLSAIYWSRITTVFYGNTRKDAAEIGFDDSLIYDEIKKPIEERKVQMTQMNSTDAKKSFEYWNKYDKRIDY